jgi:hypothetical protein
MFGQKGAMFMLLKLAYTGIAASIVDRKTMHIIGYFSLNTSAAMNDETKAKLQAFWQHIRYPIIDEISMLSKTFLAQLFQNIDIGVTGTNVKFADHLFGGINMILCRDFHQFPPMATPHWEALYQPISNSDTPDSQLGCKIYEEFMTVILLKEQM